MPRFDKTGPEGKGPRTGLGLGRCTDESLEKRINAIEVQIDEIKKMLENLKTNV